jgi:hypothetical protein
MLLGNSLITAFYRAARPSQQAFQSHTKDSRPFREYSGIPGEIRIIAPPALAALQQLEKQISARTTKVCFSNWVFGSSSFSFFLSGHCHSSGSRFSSQSG